MEEQEQLPVDKNCLVSRMSAFVLKKPLLCFILSTLFFLALAPGMLAFEEEYNVRVWFLDTDKHIKVLNSFEKQFGNDESLVVVVNSDAGIFTKESVEILKGITEGLWKVTQVIRVDSLTNYNMTTANGDDIEIQPFLDEVELSQETLLVKKDEALRHKVLPGYLVSKDAHSAMIFARLAPTLDGSPNYKAIVKEAREVVAKFKDKSGHKIYMTGEAAVNDAFREISMADSMVILPMLFLLVIVYLLLVFRSFLAMFLPLAIMGMSVIMTLGVCFYSGFKYNEILTILPGILLAISIADSVHVIVSYFQFKTMGYSQKIAVFKSLEKNFIPTILTSVSTMLGFFSLMFTELKPIRQLGLLGGVGTGFAWIITIYWAVPLLYWIKIKAPNHFKHVVFEDGHPADWAIKVTSLLKRHRVKIVGFFILTSIVAIIIGSFNQVNSNPYLYFTKKIPLRIANDFVEENFGGNGGPEIMIYSGKEDGIKDPNFLKEVEVFKNWIDKHPKVNKTIDIIDILKQMHQVLNGGGEDQYVLAHNQETIAQELFLYTMGLPQGMDVNNQITIKNDAIRMTVLWAIFDTRGWLENVSLLEAKAKELGLKIDITGKFLLFQRMMEYVVVTFFSSIGLAFFLVASLMMFVFRSFKIGLLSLVPNVIPLFYGAAFMYMMGMSLNIGTSLVASVCLGIAVDDTIHFLANFMAHRKKGISVEESIARIFTYTGSALFFTTVILVSAFSLEMLGDFIPNVNFGQLCAIVLSLALVVDLVFLPALLLVLDRSVPKKGGAD